MSFCERCAAHRSLAAAPGALLRHLPFFEALGAAEEGTAEWHALSAGLTTLRLVDHWLAEGADATRADRWAVHAVRRAVSLMEADDPARQLLGGLVELVDEASLVDVDLLAPRLLAYAHVLDLGSRFALAADVLETVVEVADVDQHPDVAVDARVRLGVCLREMGRLEDAAASHAAAGAVARRMGDERRVLHTQMADARLALARGDLATAAAILDETVRATDGDNRLIELRSTALHERASVAFAAGAHERAVQLAFAALEGAQRQSARDRLLADLATMLTQVGAHDAARDALLVLTVAAGDEETRWAARIELLGLAMMDGAELPFEQHHRTLNAAALPPKLAAKHQLHAGLGFLAFGRRARARSALRTAVALAETHGLAPLRCQAIQALGDLDRSEAPRRVVVAVPRPRSPSLEVVTAAIREMREMAT